MANAYIATQDASISTPDGTAYIKKGITRAIEGAEVLKQHPELFAPAEDGAHFGHPETTRQEPQVPRARTADKPAPAKKTAAKKAADKPGQGED